MIIKYEFADRSVQNELIKAIELTKMGGHSIYYHSDGTAVTIGFNEYDYECEHSLNSGVNWLEVDGIKIRQGNISHWDATRLVELGHVADDWDKRNYLGW